jgi:hypothetical protein
LSFGVGVILEYGWSLILMIKTSTMLAILQEMVFGALLFSGSLALGLLIRWLWKF